MMKGLIQCAFCGKITALTRSDRLTCGNSCSVKLIYSRTHNFQTPLENYLKFIEENIEDENETDNLINSLDVTLKRQNENNVKKIITEPFFKKEQILIQPKLNAASLTEIEEKIKKYNTKLKTI